MPNNRIHLACAFIVLGFQAIDCISTMYCLNTGLGYEGNPIMALITANPAAFMILKAAAAPATLFIAYITAAYTESIGKYWFVQYLPYIVMGGFGAAATINNITVMR